MEIFESLRKHFAMSGIAVSKNDAPKRHPFNGKNSIIFILFCVSVGLTTLSINDANTFDECTDIMFRSISAGVCGLIYAAIVWKTSKLYEFINILNVTVQESEYIHSMSLHSDNTNTVE